jgi:hypothetical protein
MARMIEEHDRGMREIRESRERWAREKGQPRRSAPPPARARVEILSSVRPSPPRRPAPVPAVRQPARREPSRVCNICLEPALLVPGTLRCAPCAAEVSWRVRLAQQGLRVVP